MRFDFDPAEIESEALDTAQWLGMYAQGGLLPFTTHRLRRAAALMELMVRERAQFLVNNPGFGGK